MTSPTQDAAMIPERRWWCSYCDTFYAEYVNGCPRCHLGEPGTSTSVRVVWAYLSYDNWVRITDESLIAELRSKAEAERDELAKLCDLYLELSVKVSTHKASCPCEDCKRESAAAKKYLKAKEVAQYD